MADTALILAPAVNDRVNAAFARVLADLASEHSVRAYREDWQRWGEYLASQGIPPMAVETRDVQTYLLKLRAEGKRSTTRGRALAILRVIYSALVREGVLPVNPAREARNPKGDVTPPRTPWLTEADLGTFLNAPVEPGYVNERDYLIAATLAITGLRREEVAKLAVENLEPPDATGARNLKVRVKGGKHGRVKLIAPLAQALERWAAQHKIRSGPLFRADPKLATPVSVGTVRSAVKRRAAQAGFADDARFAPHAFRRTLATTAYQRGVPVEQIQQTLLHSKVATTMRYIMLARPPVGVGGVMVDLLPDWMRDPVSDS